jgi:diaminopimelate epimerase
LTIVRAHAYGNDFLLLSAALVPADADRPALARGLCDRHRGLGGDGLIIHRDGEMSLLNADGSYSEVSGNGVRCLAAWMAEERGLAAGGTVDIRTDAGVKRLEALRTSGAEWTFRAAMGEPEAIARVTIEVGQQPTEVITMRVGNPQCVVLGAVTPERLHALAARLAVHPHFPHGTNVELAAVEAPDRVRILIWERGVGPTEASGTGACAAAVAAMAFGGASRDVQVVSPGGSQRVEWLADGLYLTGTAAIIATCEWRGRVPTHA